MYFGQFCVIVFVNVLVVINGIVEFEYYVEVMVFMGYGQGWYLYGVYINIYGGVKVFGVEGVWGGFVYLLQVVCNLIIIENDEVSFGFDDFLLFVDDVLFVFDFYYYWIMSQGEYIEFEDLCIVLIIVFWCGVRLVSYVSVFCEEFFLDYDIYSFLDFKVFVVLGIKLKDLWGYLDLMWNEVINDLVMWYFLWFDFEIEVKLKNIVIEGLVYYVERWNFVF